MPALGRTIQIYLPSGEPRGIRIAEITTGIVLAISIPRARMAEAAQRQELRSVGVYFLFGTQDELAKPLTYVGEAEDCLARLRTHASKKEFWSAAVAIVSRTGSFTKAHARWLEWRCLTRAREVGRYEDTNEQTPNKPCVPEPMEADLRNAFDALETLLGTLGFPLFEPLRRVDGPEHVFFSQRGGAKARGILSDDGFVVLAGSVARVDVTPSAPTWIADTRERLIASGVLIQEKAGLRFASDHVFSSPSAAASAVVGGSANGWIEWKDDRRQTLQDVHRAEDESSPTDG
jgi:uncharacterized protein DUF4357